MTIDASESPRELFAPVIARFDRPGVERGGCPRHGVTPVHVRKFGAHAATIFPGLATVESTFTESQLAAVKAALLASKSYVVGAAPTLADRIVQQFLHTTRPYFLLAMLRATAASIAAFLAHEPQHAPVFDAIFCVAGSEGLRDLIRFYDARVLEQILAQRDIEFPDILAFVHLHQRTVRSSSGHVIEQQYEVWCPGYDFAKEYHAQCVAAAQQLVVQHGITWAPSLAEEVQQLPDDLVGHLTQFVRAQAR